MRSDAKMNQERSPERMPLTEEARVAKLQRFAGLWVALEDDEVVSAAKTASEAAANARATGTRVPYLLFVEAISADAVKIGL